MRTVDLVDLVNSPFGCLTREEVKELVQLLKAVLSDDFGHALHQRFYGGVDPQGHNQDMNGEPLGDCYKCRIVRDFVREYVAVLASL